MAALLGSAYFSNAQVGIGTPTPVTSSMLDITSTTKGVLIPRVALTDKEAFSPVEGTEVTSLLVYNTNTANEGVATKEVTPGFYYWNVNKWERIVSQTDLTNAIENANAELEDIIKLLQTAYPSNNLDGSTTSGATLGGGMVYTPGSGTPGTPGYVPAKIEYVYYNETAVGTEGEAGYIPIGYVKQDITSAIVDLINANESKTKIVTIDNKQYYVSESYTGTTDPTLGTEPGVFLIDVVGGVVNNIEEIFTTQTTIVINEGDTNEQTFTTVQEYIEYIISESDLQEGVMTFVPGTGTTPEEQLASSSFTYTLADGTQSTSVTFSALVRANQSRTDIATTNTNNVINYVYTAEPDLNGTPRIFTINLTQDLISQITNNGDVKNAITNVMGGGVYYNGTGSALMVGTVSIPAGSLYTKDSNGNGVLIDLGSIVVSEVIENFNTIVNSPVTVNTIQYDSVEEYIQYIAETSDANVGFTTTEITAANNPGGTLIPANSFYYINDAGVKVIIDLEDLVLANESKTGFVTGTNTDGNTFIYYIGEEYLAQNDFPTEAIANGWANGATLPTTVTLLDIPQAVSTNFETILDQTTTIEIPGQTNQYYTVEQVIQNIANSNGTNVGYTTVAIPADATTGQTAIPANSLYYLGENDIKIEINIARQLIENTTLIEGNNLTTEQIAQNVIIQNNINQIKNNLGDNFNTSTVVKTGDTWIDGKSIYKAVIDSEVLAGSANLSNSVAATQTTPEVPGFVTIPGTVENMTVVGIRIIGSNGVSASATDLSVNGNKVSFRIGTGNMYNVIYPSGVSSTSIKVMVEFAADYTAPVMIP